MGLLRIRRTPKNCGISDIHIFPFVIVYAGGEQVAVRPS